MAREYAVARRSLFGPLFLIGIGVLMLLAMTHAISAPNLAVWFSRYWPAILIFWGAVRLIEFIIANRRGTPAPRFGGGGVALAILIICFGAAATAAHHARAWANVNDFDFDNDQPWAQVFMGEPHEFDFSKDAAVSGNTVQVQADRADISVTTSPDAQVHAKTHVTVYAHSDGEADDIAKRIENDLTIQNGLISLVGHGGQARESLELQVPANVELHLSTGRGDVNVRDHEAAVIVDLQHGTVQASNVKGPLTVHAANRADVTIDSVTGDVSLDGRYDDVAVNDVSGAVQLSGDFYGDLKLSKVEKGVRFSSSRTNLQFPKLDGTLDMGGGDLHVTSVTGPFKLTTRSKDVHLEQVSGDVEIEDSNASIELHPSAPVASVRVHDERGSIEFVAPPQSDLKLDAQALHGEISSTLDGITVQNNNSSSTASGTLGKGKGQVVLVADHGSINLRTE